MQRKLNIICTFAMAITLISSNAMASDMYGYFFNKQRQTLPAIVQNCLFEGDDATCATALRELVQAEMGLVSYGKNYVDEDLYSRLSSDLGDNQHRQFAWRVLKERLKKNNCDIESAASVFP